MSASYTAALQQREAGWIGWIEEISGINAQGASRKELLENLESALAEALEMNRTEARASFQGDYEEVILAV